MKSKRSTYVAAAAAGIVVAGGIGLASMSSDGGTTVIEGASAGAANDAVALEDPGLPLSCPTDLYSAMSFPVTETYPRDSRPAVEIAEDLMAKDGARLTRELGQRPYVQTPEIVLPGDGAPSVNVGVPSRNGGFIATMKFTQSPLGWQLVHVEQCSRVSSDDLDEPGAVDLPS